MGKLNSPCHYVNMLIQCSIIIGNEWTFIIGVQLVIMTHIISVGKLFSVETDTFFGKNRKFNETAFILK